MSPTISIWPLRQPKTSSVFASGATNFATGWPCFVMTTGSPVEDTSSKTFRHRSLNRLAVILFIFTLSHRLRTNRPHCYTVPLCSPGEQKGSLLSAAAEFGLVVVGSATLHQGKLTHGLPDFVSRILGLKSDAENAIQFSRSAPGMTTALVGMGHKEHVAANLKPAQVPPTAAEEWKELFHAK